MVTFRIVEVLEQLRMFDPVSAPRPVLHITCPLCGDPVIDFVVDAIKRVIRGHCVYDGRAFSIPC